MKVVSEMQVILWLACKPHKFTLSCTDYKARVYRIRAADRGKLHGTLCPGPHSDGDLSHYRWSPHNRSPGPSAAAMDGSPGPCTAATLGPGPSTAVSITTVGPP